MHWVYASSTWVVVLQNIFSLSLKRSYLSANLASAFDPSLAVWVSMQSTGVISLFYHLVQVEDKQQKLERAAFLPHSFSLVSYSIGYTSTLIYFKGSLRLKKHTCLLDFIVAHFRELHLAKRKVLLKFPFEINAKKL